MARLGIALWIVGGVLGAFLARIVPFRRGKFVLEVLVGSVAAAAGGLLATALDFGGWNEPDGRAAVFAFLVALAVIGALRAVVRPS